MYLYYVYERFVDKGLPSEVYEGLVKLLVYVEARTRYETLEQVLEFIGRAKEENASLDDVEKIIADWVSAANTFYERTLLDELLFGISLDYLRMLGEKRRVKTPA